MPTIDHNFIARKERAIAEDLKTAFSGYERLVRQIGEIRRWTVTVEVAAIGIGSSAKVRATSSLLLGCVALFAFLLLELRERSSMRFNKKEVLQIEQIFMENNSQAYIAQITAYKFRDLRLSKLDRGIKLNHLVASLFDLNVVVWYGFWLLVLVLAFVKLV